MDHAPPAPAEAGERWEWRRRLREVPRRYRAYRLLVALAGVVLVLVGVALSPVPGPGGIPLVLSGLAVLASEFRWARRLLDRATSQLVVLSRWAARQPAWLRAAGSAGLLLVVAGGAYAGLVLAGAPGWLPAPLLAGLLRLPGVEAWGGPLG